jgi:hypothetical protein
VEANAYILLTLIPKVKTAINTSTAAETVTKLFLIDGLIAMINVSSIRNNPPAAAMRKRYRLATSAEISLGGFPSANALFRAARSLHKYLIHAGTACMSALRSASTCTSDSSKYA